jgi:hypothetical protein
MADNKAPEQGKRFRLYDNGPMVSAEEGLAGALQGKKPAGYVGGDTRRSDRVETADDKGVARTDSLEQEYANTDGGVVTTTENLSAEKPARSRRSGN